LAAAKTESNRVRFRVFLLEDPNYLQDSFFQVIRIDESDVLQSTASWICVRSTWKVIEKGEATDSGLVFGLMR